MKRLIIASGRNGDQRVETDLSLTKAVEVLRGLTGNSFATSLARDFDRYGDRLTGNRKAWVFVVAQQSIDRTQRDQDQPREILGNFDAITKLFEVAGSRLKFPKVELDTADGRTVVLALAGDKSKYSGQVNVSSGHKYGDPDGRFYGRIAQDGTTGIRDEGVLDLLRRFAADPAGVAAEYGRRVGQCCFCRIGLSDDRSLAVGYGPKCAENYSLPWGNKRQRPEQVELPLAEPDYEAEVARAELANEIPLSLDDLLDRARRVSSAVGYRDPGELVGAGSGSSSWRDDD